MTSQKKKVVVILSGGMDSFTVLHKIRQEEPDVQIFCLTFDYGQRHRKEIDYAARICAAANNVHHKIVDVSAMNQLIGGSSSLMSQEDIPEGHYQAETMKSTVVPNRNMILLSMAVGYAVSLEECFHVYYGAHGGDHALYPDCRPEFVHRMNDVCAIANYDKIEIVTPFLHASKIDILTQGLAWGLDYGLTWTCYNGRERACGKCGACQERLEAFAKNNVTDPLEYEE